MAATLTDRYIAATVRTLPPDAQADVRAELAASIGDDLEARLEQGEAQEDAERAVLTALGDPDVLAASYADRPLRLIGPRYYLTWWRLLKLLWAFVPVSAVAGVLIALLIADTSIAETIGTLWTVAIGTFVHVGFWTTLVFFILERTGTDTGVRWTLDALPELQETGGERGKLVASLVFLGIAATAVLWDRTIGFVFVAKDGVDIGVGVGSQTVAMPALNPDLWPWGLGAMLIANRFRSSPCRRGLREPRLELRPRVVEHRARRRFLCAGSVPADNRSAVQPGLLALHPRTRRCTAGGEPYSHHSARSGRGRSLRVGCHRWMAGVPSLGPPSSLSRSDHSRCVSENELGQGEYVVNLDGRDRHALWEEPTHD
jgi:hypothetical protein